MRIEIPTATNLFPQGHAIGAAFCNRQEERERLAHFNKPYGNEFCDRVKMGASSVKKALSFLIKHDFIHKGKDENYRVLDPAVETYLLQINAFDFIE